MSLQLTYNQVSEYYGKILESKKDLKTSACCSIDSVPDHIRNILSQINGEVLEKFYGCGSPIPYVLDGMKVLDLGCGTGRDCYILSAMVGENGEVTGIDMTDEQLEVARRCLPEQTNAFGFTKPNIKFVKGYIEDLRSANLPDNYFDLVVSNCVVNLSPDKEAVMEEVYRVLKPGGEMFFSDVYADRRLPEWAKEDQVLLGECLGGALYWKDFERLAKHIGFHDPRVYTSSKIDLFDDYTKDKIGFAKFCSVTYRLFKIPQLEDACEDYGQSAVYKGTIPHSKHEFILDNHHTFKAGKPMLVCSNTAFMLSETRLKPHFEIQGDLSTHYGLFEGCGETPLVSSKKDAQPQSCC